MPSKKLKIQDDNLKQVTKKHMIGYWLRGKIAGVKKLQIANECFESGYHTALKHYNIGAFDRDGEFKEDFLDDTLT